MMRDDLFTPGDKLPSTPQVFLCKFFQVFSSDDYAGAFCSSRSMLPLSTCDAHFPLYNNIAVISYQHPCGVRQSLCSLKSNTTSDLQKLLGSRAIKVIRCTPCSHLPDMFYDVATLRWSGDLFVTALPLLLLRFAASMLARCFFFFCLPSSLHFVFPVFGCF